MAIARFPVNPTSWMLPENEIHVWRVRAAPVPADFDELQSLLSADERVRAGRFHFEADRHRLTIGRGWLRRLVGQCLGSPPGAVAFAYGPQGKPELPGAGRLSFNLAHSQECILIALAWNNPLGIDVEFVRSMPRALSIGRRHFTPAECRLLESDPGQRDGVFFRLWARKEAVIKAVGSGLTMPLNQFDVSSSPDVAEGWSTAAVTGERPSRWFVRDLPAPAGYCAALAVAERPRNLCYWEV